MMRLDPLPEPAELRQYYPASYWFAPDRSAAGRLEEAYRRLVLRDHARFVQRALDATGARGTLLDVGCGGGLFLGMMRERGRRVVGLDNSVAAAAIAWRRQRVPAVCGDLESAPLAAGAFAVITMFHVLEHVPDPRAYIATAHRLLEPGGRFIAQTPNAACWQFRLLGRAWNGLDVPRHLFDFRARDLERLIESCGFVVVRRKHFSWRDNPAGLASSLAPGLDPMARRTRRVRESSAARIAKDTAHFALALGGLPFTLLEAAAGAGSTIMIEARKP
jgi:SAM-dependent methyltransferase